MKNLFIDSNIWLSLYHFTSDDLTQFEKLKDFLDKDIRLWIPHQVYDEVLRNREAKIQDAFKKFEFSKIQYPVFCRQYDEYAIARLRAIAALETITTRKYMTFLTASMLMIFWRTTMAS